MKHQIIPVSKDLATIYLGIKEFSPEAIHLIYCKEDTDIFSGMLGLLSSEIKVFKYESDPYDGKRIEEICESIHRDYPDDEICYNLSGSRKIMMVASCHIAFMHKCNAFLISQNDELIMLPTYRKEKVSKSLENEEFIRINEENLESYSDFDDLTKEDLACAGKIKKFIESDYDSYIRIKKTYRKNPTEDFSGISIKRRVSEDLLVEISFGALSVFRNSVCIFKSENRKACDMFFLGRWWETLVAGQIGIWRMQEKNDSDIWQSVVFSTETASSSEEAEDGTTVKNEIDIMVNDDTRLLIIECKSGYISQNNIYKLDSVRETYGGDKSKAILVSYYPLDDSLQEKCEDLDIMYFAPPTFEERINYLNKLPQWLEQELRGKSFPL